MAATLICITSTMAFCLCARLLLEVLGSARRPAWMLNTRGGIQFSASARRLARTYAAFAIVVLMGLSAIGAVSSFVEIFTHGIG